MYLNAPMTVETEDNDTSAWLLPTAFISALIAMALSLLVPMMHADDHAIIVASAEKAVGGEVNRGPDLMKRYGCGACHIIPGVRGGKPNVGPSLADFASRPTIGNHVQNTPDNLVKWIIHPAAVDENALMPSVGVSAKDARDIATYLYTLK